MTEVLGDGSGGASMFGGPLGFRCRICKTLRQEVELGHIKKAGALERTERREMGESTNYEEASNIELIAYCLKSEECQDAAVEMAGDLLVK